MDEFLQQPSQLPQGPSPWQMDALHHELHHMQQNGSNGWAAEFDTSRPVQPMQAAQMPMAAGFNPAEFAKFQHMQSEQRTASPATAPQATASMYQSPMMNYGGMGMMGGMRSYTPMFQSQPMMNQETTSKGKSRMVELDDTDWEQQFAQLDKHDDLAEAAIEAELNDLDRSVEEQDFDADYTETGFGDFEAIWKGIQAEAAAARQLAEENEPTNYDFTDLEDWRDFDGLNTVGDANPTFGEYMFEIDNPFESHANPYEEGLRIMDSGGNLSLAALAFEAAVQKDGTHVDAWVRLGSAQAQNEKETPAIRALEEAIKQDPNNLEALMGLAVSYTNESYESSAYRTLERWLAAKYPQVITEPLDEPKELGLTSRIALHQKVTDLFIKAAQLSPSGDLMDPDVQVGLGVLFYAADEFDKAVDCFEAALASSETGIANRQQNLHLLWNRLGATLANSGRSEEAIQAYERALDLRPNFVRARYNLGVSCINIGVLPEAAGHLLGALSMHQINGQEAREKAKEIVAGDNPTGGDISDADLDRLIAMNESTNLYETLRRVFTNMGRKDLTEVVRPGMDLNQFRKDFDF